jgi:hypothetical protein
MLMSDSVPDLSWEEITTNIEQLKLSNIRRPTAVATVAYLEEIGVVNDALRRGVAIAIRVAGHNFTCLPGELHTVSNLPEEGCLLLLRKVIVEFRQEGQNRVCRITLRFWDDTHQQEVLWGATTVQPQWATIVQQAQHEETSVPFSD